jgi:hypothetical protein
MGESFRTACVYNQRGPQALLPSLKPLSETNDYDPFQLSPSCALCER